MVRQTIVLWTLPQWITTTFFTKKNILINTLTGSTWLFCFLYKGPSRLGEPGPRLQQIMDSGKSSLAGESMSLNASIRERLRSKVRGRQVFLKHHPTFLYRLDKGKGLVLKKLCVHINIISQLHKNLVIYKVHNDVQYIVLSTQVQAPTKFLIIS